MTDTDFDSAPMVRELSKGQRRVLGVLIEKGLTTPEAYPLTLKATTTGCNQKSNRSPITNYSEDQVVELLDELRTLGLVAEVHTEGGRTERFRHYVRKRYPFSEPQLAIVAELLLRGQQTLGELRSRASRMVPIDSLEQLREELRGLQELKLLQASGDLQRRGVEVDHGFYKPNERMTLTPAADDEPEPSPLPASGSSPAESAPTATEPPPRATSPTSPSATPSAPASPPADPEQLLVLQREIDSLRSEQRVLRESIESLQSDYQDLLSQFEQLRTDLGG